MSTVFAARHVRSRLSGIATITGRIRIPGKWPRELKIRVSAALSPSTNRRASRVARFRATLANPNRCAHTSSLPHLATAHRTRRRSLASRRDPLARSRASFPARWTHAHVRATRTRSPVLVRPNARDKDRTRHVEKTRKLPANDDNATHGTFRFQKLLPSILEIYADNVYEDSTSYSFRNRRTSVVARCQQRKRNVARLKEAKGKAGQSSDALARCADIPLALRYARPASPDRDYFPPGAPRFTFSWRTER